MLRKLCPSRQQIIAVFVLSLAFTLTLSAQVMQGPTTIRQNVHHDVSPPLSEMIKNAPAPDLTRHEVEPMKRIPLPPGLAPLTEDPVRQVQAPVTPSPAVGLSFEGLGQGQYGFGVQYIPPDTNGAVGATQYIQWVNTSFAIFNKSTGALIAGPSAATRCGRDLAAAARPTTTAIRSSVTTSWPTAG